VERRDGAPARPAARLVVPASAAARLRAAPLLPPGSIQELALGGDGSVPRPAVRARGGSPSPAPQPCLSPRR
jgi:hypothetical protein